MKDKNTDPAEAQFIATMEILKLQPVKVQLSNFVTVMTQQATSATLTAPMSLFDYADEMLGAMTFMRQVDRRVCMDMQSCFKHLRALKIELEAQEPVNDEELDELVDMVVKKFE